MASYVQAESFCQASVPVRATSTSCPSAVRMSFTRADIVSLSSATKIRIRAASFPSVASPGVSAGGPAFRRAAPPPGPGPPSLHEGGDHGAALEHQAVFEVRGDGRIVVDDENAQGFVGHAFGYRQDARRTGGHGGRGRAGQPQATQSAMKTFKSRGDAAPRLDEKASRRPSGENMGNEANVSAYVVRTRPEPS